MSLTDRLRAGLAKSRDKLAVVLGGILSRRDVDPATYEHLESALVAADVGVPAATHLLAAVRRSSLSQSSPDDPKGLLRAALIALVTPLEKPLSIGSARPFVIMVVGVNGAGKTTTIGKLTRRFCAQGHSVLLAAGDTFRAAAREQLSIWGERNGVTVISQAGGDPAAVMFDAINAARARSIDIVLADTAGRLATQSNLMEELKKVRRVIEKAQPGAPHETLLVLDANTGQNALAQVAAFDRALGLSGLILTKLDGTAKGGVVAAIAKEHPIALRFLGIGEGQDDLEPFIAADFVDALLG